MPARKAFKYSVNSNDPELEQVVHTHRTSYRRGWLRGFAELNPSPHSQEPITPVTPEYLLPSQWTSVLFTSATVRIPVHYTKVWRRAYPLCDASLLRSARVFLECLLINIKTMVDYQ